MTVDAAERTPREQALDALLGADGPLDATAIAERLGVHVTTARFHLDHLVRQGLAEGRPEPSGRRGRPRILFSPAAGARAERARAREQLIEVLAAALGRADSGAERAAVAGSRWAESLIASRGVSDRDAEGDPLVEVLDELGFAPEVGEKGIRLHACPFGDAARHHPEVVCGVHRGLVERLSGPGRSTTLVPFAQPSGCLVRLDEAHGERVVRR